MSLSQYMLSDRFATFVYCCQGDLDLPTELLEKIGGYAVPLCGCGNPLEVCINAPWEQQCTPLQEAIQHCIKMAKYESTIFAEY